MVEKEGDTRLGRQQDEEAPMNHAATAPSETTPLHPHGFPVKHHHHARKTHRMIYSDMVPREIRTTHTIAASFLGEGSTAEAILFEMGVRNHLWQGIIWGLWFVGAAIGLLVVGRALPLNYVWASLLMLPLPVVTILLVSTQLCKELLGCIDLWIIYILQFALIIDGLMFCKADLRRVFWFCYLPTMVASGLADAFPAKYRAKCALMYFGSALVILLVWNAFLIFRWEYFGDLTKLSNVAVLIHHISDTVTLLVFYCRHIWCSTQYPDHFVMIKAEVLTGLKDDAWAEEFAHLESITHHSTTQEFGGIAAKKSVVKGED